MNCQQCDEQLIDYVVAELAPDARSAVAAHLAECPTCALASCRLRADLEGVSLAVTTDLTAAWPDELQAQVQTQIPLGRFAQPEEIAAAVSYLASDAASFITGVTLDVNGGLYLR